MKKNFFVVPVALALFAMASSVCTGTTPSLDDKNVYVVGLSGVT